MDQLAEMMVSRTGRWTNIGLGAALIAAGASTRRPWLAVLGGLTAVAGVADVFPLAPLFGLPVTGHKIRRELGVLDAPLLPEQKPN